MAGDDESANTIGKDVEFNDGSLVIELVVNLLIADGIQADNLGNQSFSLLPPLIKLAEFAIGKIGCFDLFDTALFLFDLLL